MSTKLRLTVVVWVLWAWVVVGFAGGIAHADDTPSPAGDSTSVGSPASKDSKTDPDADPDRKPDTEKPDREAPESPTDENAATAEDTDTDTDPPTGAVAPPTADPAPEATEDTKDPAPDSRRSSLHHDVTKQSPTPTKPIAAEPRTPADDVTSHRSSASIEQPPTQTSSRTQQALTVAPSGPTASISQPGTDTQNLPQLGRQVVGLVSDIGTVVMSAVYTVADTVAKAFGPDSFFGVPYALATAVANSAAAVSRTLIGAPDHVGTGRFPVNYGIINGLTFFNPQGRPPVPTTRGSPSPTSIPFRSFLSTERLPPRGKTGESARRSSPTPDTRSTRSTTETSRATPISRSRRRTTSGSPRASSPPRWTGSSSKRAHPKVILIGHSQGGGILPAYYINNMNGADKVSQLIGIAPSNHGTDFNGLIGLQNLPILGPLVLGVVNAFGHAFLQQSLGSHFQQEVYGNGDTRPGVLYTMIASTHDEVVTPYTQQALNGARVTNIVIQDLYPGLPVGHLGVVLSPQVLSVVLDALASNPQANPLADPQQSVELVA